MAQTAAAKNKAIRQKALREQLSNQKLVEKVIDIAKKLEEQGGSLETIDIQRLKAAADINLKLINKYLPDLKGVELSGIDGDPIEVDQHFTVEVIDASHSDT